MVHRPNICTCQQASIISPCFIRDPVPSIVGCFIPDVLVVRVSGGSGNQYQFAFLPQILLGDGLQLLADTASLILPVHRQI